MKSKKIITILIAVLTFSSLFAVSPEEAHWKSNKLKAEGFVVQAKNNELELWYNKKIAVFAVRVKESGYVWYSSPMNWEDDQYASGFTKNAIPSLLSIRAKDKNSTFRPANSYVNSVKRKGLSVVKIDNGIQLRHRFVREGITIPLNVTLEDNSVIMSVPLAEIDEEEDDEGEIKLRVLDLTIAQYFGAAAAGEEGFMFVPDGSGAVIEFSNHRSENPYQQYIYGRDASVIPVKKKNVQQNVSLPVFGLSREGAGFLAIVEDSAARGIINAETAGQKTNYNAANAGCIVRDYDAFTFRERSGTPRDIRLFEKTDLTTLEDVFSVRYILLDDTQNNIASMAEIYRDYLQTNGKLTDTPVEKEPALVLNFIGSSIKKLPVAGIPVNQDVPFTTFEAAKKTIEELKNQGISNFIVKYDGWVKGGVLGKYPSSPDASSKLGGHKELQKLIDYLEEENIPFYLGGDFVNLFQEDITHLKELTVNHAMNRSPVKIPDYKMSTYTDEKNSADAFPYWILRAVKTEGYFTKFMKKFDEKYPKTGIAPDTIGNVLGTDFGDSKGASRTTCASIYAKLLEDNSQKHSLMLSRPNDYALPFVSYASDLPMTSSMYDVESYSVPFYQMVLKGYVPFSNLPGNRCTNIDDYKLGLLETGADVSFLWLAEHTDYIRDSRLQWFVNVFEDDWKNDAVKIYKEVSAVTELVKDASITGYTVDGNERTTEFSNGVVISVNYSDKTYSVSR